MSAPHCRAPAACSICLGASARRVTLASDGPRVDGEVPPPSLREVRQRQHSQRGQRARQRRKEPG